MCVILSFMATTRQHSMLTYTRLPNLYRRYSRSNTELSSVTISSVQGVAAFFRAR